MTSIYLAGKINKNDWRNCRDIINNDDDARQEWSTLHHTLGGFEVTGPFFVGCDHGCSHIGGGSHANRLECGTSAIAESRRWTHRQCTAAIARADVFFAWLNDDLTAYGTLVEIGQAHALGKFIVIGVPDHTEHPWSDYNYEVERFHNPAMDNLWYAASCADRVIRASHPLAAIGQIPKDVDFAGTNVFEQMLLKK